MKTDADETHVTPPGGEDPFIYRGRPIPEYKLTASKILIGPTAWNRLPDFARETISLCNGKNRSYLYRKEFEPLVERNYNDYLRISCQLG